MELTSEHKQRIQKEEEQRIAEERYRAQIRSQLKPESAPELPLYSRSEPEPDNRSNIGLMVGLVAVLVLGGIAFLKLYRPAPGPGDPAPGRAAGAFSPRIRYVPVSQSIANGQITVGARGYWRYSIRITDDMLNAHLTGSFNAAGGSGNDVEVAILDAGEWPNWENGHETSVRYSSDGKKTTGTFDVILELGTYILVFNNRFSLVNSKLVGLQVDLNYRRQETY